MSNRLLDACKPLRMPPTAKSVLICLADYADDAGSCWPSIDRIVEFTCFGRTAVIDAIKWLESASLITANRANGRHTTYLVHPAKFCEPVQQANQSTFRTSTAGGPVRLPDETSTAGGPHQYGSRTAPVREADSNPQEPSRTPNKATPKGKSVDLPDWLPDDAWANWVSYRKAAKKPLTERAVSLSIRELDKLREQGHQPQDVIDNAILRGWQGLYAPAGNRGPPGAKPSAAASFHGKTYTGTPIDDIPESLRPAA